MVYRNLPFTLMGIWGFTTKNENKEPTVNARDVLLAKADALFDQGQYKQLCDFLSNHNDSNDVEILWRLCRAMYNMSKTTSEVEAKKMIYEAYDLICKAQDIQEKHYAVHKWISILLDSKCTYEGMKARIKELHNIKTHMLKAAELNPKDATILYMLGNWCFQISELSWYQRKLAAALFGEPPKSSFEEALMYFEAAENIDPNFYSYNLLMLGKTYLKLQKKEDAIKYLKMTSEFLARNDEDHNAKQEAQKLLNSM